MLLFSGCSIYKNHGIGPEMSSHCLKWVHIKMQRMTCAARHLHRLPEVPGKSTMPSPRGTTIRGHSLCWPHHAGCVQSPAIHTNEKKRRTHAATPRGRLRRRGLVRAVPCEGANERMEAQSGWRSAEGAVDHRARVGRRRH